jgi:hypothetical protein
MGLVTVICALIAGAAGAAAWRASRQTRGLAEPRPDGTLRPTPVWALGGLLLSSVFVLLILLIGGLEVVLNAAACS